MQARYIVVVVVVVLLMTAISYYNEGRLELPLAKMRMLSPAANVSFPRPGERILVARSRAVTFSQLGNHIYEMLSFQSMAKKLGRKPVYVFGDSSTMSAQKNFWTLQQHYPNVIKGIDFVYDSNFFKKKWYELKVPDPHIYYDVTINRQEHDKYDVVLCVGRHWQNIKYLDDFGGHDYISSYIFDFPPRQQFFARAIVPEAFHQAQRRLCVHTRRADFIRVRAQFSTLENVIPQAKHILKGAENASSVVMFGDDDKFLRQVIEHKSFAAFRGRVFIPMRDTKHFVWTFAKHFCTDVYLSAAESTFGFWCGYAAPSTTRVFIVRPTDPAKRKKSPPPLWTELPEDMGRL